MQTPPVVHENIRALQQARAEEESQKSFGVQASEAITSFAGSLTFVWIHAAILVVWLLVNTRVISFIPAWDPYPFVMLAMAASVEAIFISTFVLISQNRMAAISEKRAELDLQMNLLAEHEVTRMLQMMEKVLERLNIPNEWQDLDELKREVAPVDVLTAIEKHTERGETEPYPAPSDFKSS
jgi:uncharacterized membrane protein